MTKIDFESIWLNIILNNKKGFKTKAGERFYYFHQGKNAPHVEEGVLLMGEYVFLKNHFVSKSFLKNVYALHPNINFKNFLLILTEEDKKNIDPITFFPYIYAILNNKRIISELDIGEKKYI